MDLKGLLANKKIVWGGVAGAAALGAIAVYRKRGQTSAAAAAGGDSAASGASPSAYVPGSFPDTSGTDIASYLGDYGGQLQTALTDFLAQQAQQEQDFLAKLPTSGTTGTGPTAPTGPTGPPKHHPGPKKPTHPKPKKRKK